MRVDTLLEYDHHVQGANAGNIVTNFSGQRKSPSRLCRGADGLDGGVDEPFIKTEISHASETCTNLQSPTYHQPHKQDSQLGTYPSF